MMYINGQLVFFFTFVAGATSVPMMKYNVRLPVETSRHIFGASIGRCSEECLTRPRCKSINYLTRLQLCELNAFGSTEEQTLTDTSGYEYVDKASLDQPISPYGVVHTESYFLFQTSMSYQCNPACSLTQVCQQVEGQAMCTVAECPTPPPIENVQILGNQRHVGSRVLYQCPDGYPPDPEVRIPVMTSSCLPNGTWSPVTFTCTKCSPGWLHYGNSCYMIGTSSKTFVQSKEYCTSLGSRLIWIESLVENDFIVNTLLVSNLHPICVHIGITDIAQEGTWVYDGTTDVVGYKSWYTYEPNGNTAENCAGLYHTAAYLWVDYPCTTMCLQMCEKEMTNTPTSPN